MAGLRSSAARRIGTVLRKCRNVPGWTTAPPRRGQRDCSRPLPGEAKVQIPVKIGKLKEFGDLPVTVCHFCIERVRLVIESFSQERMLMIDNAEYPSAVSQAALRRCRNGLMRSWGARSGMLIQSLNDCLYSREGEKPLKVRCLQLEQLVTTIAGFVAAGEYSGNFRNQVTECLQSALEHVRGGDAGAAEIEVIPLLEQLSGVSTSCSRHEQCWKPGKAANSDAYVLGKS